MVSENKSEKSTFERCEELVRFYMKQYNLDRKTATRTLRVELKMYFIDSDLMKIGE